MYMIYFLVLGKVIILTIMFMWSGEDHEGNVSDVNIMRTNDG